MEISIRELRIFNVITNYFWEFSREYLLMEGGSMQLNNINLTNLIKLGI